MFARAVAAAFCCAFACLSVVGAESSGPAASDLAVYLNPGVNRSAPSLAFMRRETELLMRAAGYSVRWLDSNRQSADEGARNLVVIELVGDCAAAADPAPAARVADSPASLATSAVQDGVVLPFSRVDCAALTRMLSPLLAREAPFRRRFLFGRAMGRLLAHELYHVLAQTRDHDDAGIGKPCFTVSDLVAERFAFEPAALARFRTQSADTGSDESADSSGR